MALSPPSIDEYESFVHGEMPEDDEWAEAALQQAADLFWLATSLTEYPPDAQSVRMIKYAMMEMAQYLLVQDDNKTEIFSPYNSERIGSYSYSKLARADSKIQRNIPLGLFWWDKAVNMFATANLAAIWSVSEKVIPQPYEAHEAEGTPFEGMVPDWRIWDAEVRDEAGR